MEGLKNYREKLKAIEKLVDKMENGLLSINELAELETLMRDLYERSIILKYKAFEGKVVAAEPKVEVIVPVVEQKEEIVEKVPEIVAEVPEAPVLDFSLFDDTDDAEEEIPHVETPKPIVVETLVAKQVEEVKHVEAVKPADPSVDGSRTGTESDQKESILKQEVKQVVAETTPEPEQADPSTDGSRKGTESDRVESYQEEPLAVMREKGSSFLNRLNIVDNSISAQLARRKISTLNGAFGLNERLLYINQLFNGSGDAFSDAVKVLDSQANLDEASHKVEELAFTHSWNPEEEVVLEFLAIIKRRYA